MLTKLMRALTRPDAPATALALSRHEDDVPAPEQTATGRPSDMPYRKTYGFEGDYIDADHRHLAEDPTQQGMIDLEIDGPLLPADALKLYEMAYFCGGDMLELGAYRGLSTSLLALALANSRRKDAVFSAEPSPEAIVASQAATKGRPGGDRVAFLQSGADAAIDKFAKSRRRFRLAVLNHSRRYQPVQSACALLPKVLTPGAFVLVQGFNDNRNAAAEANSCGVYVEARRALNEDLFEFWGIYGCICLFRFKG